MSKTVLITGASTGFGRDVAETQTNWRAVTAAFRGFIEAVRRFRRERETYQALRRLSDHMLKDIGISRSEIGSIAQSIAAASKQRDRFSR